MTWLTWRQFRVQAFTATAALAAFAVLLAATGPRLASLYAASGIGGCQQPVASTWPATSSSSSMPPAPTGCCTCSAS